jgi:hypothetical protein
VIDRTLLNILPTSNPPKKLLEQVKDQIWLKHYSYRTEETDIQSILRYILFHNYSPLKDSDCTQPLPIARGDDDTSVRAGQPEFRSC